MNDTNAVANSAKFKLAITLRRREVGKGVVGKRTDRQPCLHQDGHIHGERDGDR